MGAKRPHASEGGVGDTRTSGKHAQSRPARHKRPNIANPQSAQSAAAAVNPIKAMIRDVTRLLERSNNLPAGVRIEKERALAGYRQDLEQAETEKRKQQMISKYHMVRFFERQKATRNLKKLKVRIAKADPGSTEYRNLQHDIHSAEVDVNYALYHPLDEKYQSLYPRNGDVVGTTEDGHDHSRVRTAGTTKPAVWKMVESSMTNGTLEALRDGRLTRNLRDERLKQQSQAKGHRSDSGKTAKDQNVKGLLTKKTVLSEQDADSDGGFFEE